MQNTPANTMSRLVAALNGVSHYGDLEQVSVLAKLVAKTLAVLDLPASFVQAGDRVVLKPNWVKEHDERRPGPEQWEHVVTHPAVIEAVARWAASRLEGKGSITICDAPQTDSSFAKIREGPEEWRAAAQKTAPLPHGRGRNRRRRRERADVARSKTISQRP
jgi:hypothetical protein